MNSSAGEQSGQSEVFSFLGDPATYRHSETVIRIDTHGAAVFLAGDDVFKVKRAVHLPFMDFSTLEKRRRACENEIVVNRPNAPELYLAVVPISLEDGRLKLGSGGEIVEWAVHLRRFDETRTLDRLAARGELNPGIIASLAEIVSAAHQRAPILRDMDATAALRGQIDETMTSIAAAPDVFPADAAAGLARHMRYAFEEIRPLLLRREAEGWVRRCHGDLHLRNIVMIDAKPTLFDALEFDERLATCDIWYDLAFLLMDLWTRGLCAEANLTMNQYLAHGEKVAAQLEALAALPLFLSLRAAIRAKVTNLEPARTAETLASARRLFEAACTFFEPRGLHLVAVGGLSGTGKTLLARKLAPSIGRAPGAVHLRSDVERKRLFQTPEQANLPEEAYRPEVSAVIYRRLRDLARAALAAGQSVVMDATYRKPEERSGAHVGAAAGAKFTGLWLEASTEIRMARVLKRKNDASDAGLEVVAAQTDESVGPIEWRRLDAAEPVEILAGHALTAIGVDNELKTRD